MVEYYPRLVAIKKAGYEARPVLVQYLLASMIVRMRKVFAGSLGSSLPMSWPVLKLARS